MSLRYFKQQVSCACICCWPIMYYWIPNVQFCTRELRVNSSQQFKCGAENVYVGHVTAERSV